MITIKTNKNIKDNKTQRFEHSPTLNTVIMVENVLKDAETIITVAEIKRRLPKKINHNLLKVILEYLEESRRISVGTKGMLWIHNPSKKMRNALKNAYSWPEDFPDFVQK